MRPLLGPAARAGTSWSYACGSPGVSGYLRTPYMGFAAIPVTLGGTGLDRVTSVVSNGPVPGYSVTVTSRTSTRLVLDIRATLAGPGGSLPASLPLILTWSTGRVQVWVHAIPSYTTGGRSYGQCTWYALYRRRAAGLSAVLAYANGQDMSSNPSASTFPHTGAVLMSGTSHMAYLESITPNASYLAPVAGRSQVRTYSARIAEANCDCHGTVRTVNTSLTVTWNGSAWSWTTRPTTCLTFNRIAN